MVGDYGAGFGVVFIQDYMATFLAVYIKTGAYEGFNALVARDDRELGHTATE